MSSKEGILSAVTDTEFRVIPTYKGVELPTPKDGESEQEFGARVRAAKAKGDRKAARSEIAKEAAKNRNAPVKPPFTQVEKAVQAFAKRKLVGGQTADQGVIRFTACADENVEVKAKVQTNSSTLIEIRVEIVSDVWSVEFVALKARAEERGRWKATGADITMIRLERATFDVEEAVKWLSLP